MQYLSRLEVALKSWSEWNIPEASPPVVLEPFHVHTASPSYVVRCGQRTFLVRLNNEVSLRLGGDLSAEKKILDSLAPLNIAPRWVYFCSESNATIVEHFEGRRWTESDILDPKQQQKIDRIISAYQALPIALPRFAYLDRMQNHWNELRHMHPIKASKSSFEWHRFEGRLHQWESRDWSPVLCHHRLMASNVIESSEGLKIIDWQCAGYGSPDFDLLCLYRGIKQASNTSREPDHHDVIDELIDWLIDLSNQIYLVKVS